MGDGPSSELDRGATPLDALSILASQEVALTPSLRHHEFYTLGGLLTILWHTPVEAPALPVAVVACGGAMGGLLGPAGGLYHRLGVQLAAQGVAVLRVTYRSPGDLDACCQIGRAHV